MKIYQLIYTNTLHCLSDGKKGLANQAGLRVFSCSEGLTRENINEITRFCLYRVPRGMNIPHSTVPCDPSVPELFPKVFRTLKLSDGRYAAIQSVYSGNDFAGNKGNHFAHALIFDEVDDNFFPEMYYNSPLFKTYLTKEQQESEVVRYLPELSPQRDETLDDSINDFIKPNKKMLAHLVNLAMRLMTGEEIRNICIAAEDPKLTEMYLVALKYLLPRDISRHTGISTYNVYMPSLKQSNIVFHGTIKGKNNITQENILTTQSCIYVDIENTHIEAVDMLPILNMEVSDLRKKYADCKFLSVSGFSDWCDTYKSETEKGIGAKLIKLQKSAGDAALRSRLIEIYPKISDIAHSQVKFELLKIMYDNSEKLPLNAEEIANEFITLCFDKMCEGEEYPLSELTEKITELQAKAVSGNIRAYVKKIEEKYSDISNINIKAFTEFFAILKHGANKKTWKELFLNDNESLGTFVIMSAQEVITGKGINMFSIPKYWNNADLSELVAYIEASTDDEIVKTGCLKYILTYTDEDWYSYGVMVEKRKKSAEEEEEDLKKVQRMLKKIGYLPFEKGRYEHLKTDVRSDISDNLNPLLLSKLLNAYYNWKASAGYQTKAREKAKLLKKLLLEIRDKEKAVYDFLIPKLGIEIIETPGHYHEMIINTETMPKSFWSWFIIGYRRCKSDDNKILNYQRIYLANREELLKTDMKNVFCDMFGAVK